MPRAPRKIALFLLTLLLFAGCAGRRPPATSARVDLPAAGSPDAAEATQAAPQAIEASGPETPAAEPGRLHATLVEDLHLVGRTFSLAARSELPPHTAGQWAYLGGLAATSAYLETRKEQIRRDVLRSSLIRRTGWTEIGGQLGQGRVTQTAALLLYGSGLFADLPRTRETGLLLGESYAAAQVAAGALNFVFSERRPQRGGELRYFQAGGSSTSLHMTNTVVLSTVLDHQLDALQAGSTTERVAKVLARIGLFAIPTVTAWQRMRSDQHYLWNVELGAGASWYVTRGMLRAHDRARQPASGSTGEQHPSRMPRLAMGRAPGGGRGESVSLIWEL